MSGVEVLRRARRVLLERGWCQGDYSNGEPDGPVCAVGALRVAGGGTPRGYPDDMGYYTATNTLYRVLDGRGIASWNDTPGRTLAEVLAAFAKAIKLTSKKRRK